MSVGGKTRNVLYVATEHNSVYAFDADDPAQAVPLWHVNLGTPVPSQDICVISGDTNPQDCPYLDLNPEIGITSTPVIDAGIMYVVARTKTGSSGYHFFLHALDITSGAEQPSSPMEITGQVIGSGPGSSNGILAFDPAYHLQRPGLLLMNGVVYIAFGSVGDIGTFHGWMMGYDATTLQPTMIFNITPDGKDGGIWEAGQGLVGDGLSSIYLTTGNGTFDANTSGRDYGDSILRMGTSSGLVVSDYFTPSNQATLFSQNTDLGSGGPMLLPGTTLVVGIGKDKLFRVVDTTNMGTFNSGFDGDVQEFTASSDDYLGSPVYWDSPNNGPAVYLWGANDFLTAYKLVGGQFQTTPATQSTVRNSSGFANSAPLSISADGGLVGSGIVWGATTLSGSARAASVPGVLHAFDATNLTTELWNSRQNAARDDVGNYAKWVPPTVVNGKVYLATFSGQLEVYGLNPPPAGGIHFVQVASGTPGTATASVSVSYPSAQSAGDLNVVVASWSDATSTIQSVTDSL
ncbi:MAG: pyrrolo-quinoline quinone [Terriglobales bacterium]